MNISALSINVAQTTPQNKKPITTSSFNDVVAAQLADGKPQADKKPKQSEAVKEFVDFMNKTPAQKQFILWLAKHGLTEEQFKALPPEQQKKLLAKMEQEMREQFKNNPSKVLKNENNVIL